MRLAISRQIAAALGLALVLLATSSAAALAAPNDGSVAGQVINKSAGGSSTVGTSVLLIAFGRKEQAPIGQQTAQTDAQGNYRFTDLDRDPNIVYITLARYQGVNYPTDQPFQIQDQPTVNADIAVFESTSTDEGIQLERLNLLVMGAQDGLVQFMEMG
ncbi:MAG TPA: hypothetical protein VGE94_16645, partial [Chloroflexota bacterium]